MKRARESPGGARGAEDSVKKAFSRNLSERAREYAQLRVERLERGDVRDLIIERSRTTISR